MTNFVLRVMYGKLKQITDILLLLLLLLLLSLLLLSNQEG